MMQAFRNAAKPLMVIVAFTFFAWLVLDLSGITGGTGLLTKTSVGKINGQSIDARTYQSVVQQNIDAQQRSTPGALGLEDYQQIRDRVWEQFVQSSVLESEYQRRGITVSSDEIVRALRTSPPPEFTKIPEFQTDSQFDLAKYQRWLTSSVAQQYLPALEAQYSDQIKRSKLLSVVTADVYLSDGALWQQFRDDNERVKVELAAIVPNTVIPDSVVPVSDAEIAAYYKSHPDDFKRPATAFLSYVSLPRLTNASDTAAARARADSARAEIAGGTSFADVARRESADSATAVKGGDLGEWTRGAMDPAFDSAAFAMPLNKVSAPVLSQFGFHLIEVTRRRGNKVTARHILFPIELAGGHRDALDAQADSLERLAAERTDRAALDTVARVLKLTVGHSGPVEEGTKVQLGNLVVPDAGVWAFEAKVGATSSVIESPEAFYVFRLDSMRDAGVPPLSQIRATVTHLVQEEKKSDRARKIGEDLMKRIESGATLGQAADALKLPHQEFGPFTRVQPPLDDPVVVGTAFGLDSGKVSPLLDTKKGLYVIKVLEHTKADSAQFLKDLDKFRAQMIQLARQDRVRNYLAALTDAAKVVDNRKKVLRQTQQQTDQQPLPQS